MENIFFSVFNIVVLFQWWFLGILEHKCFLLQLNVTKCKLYLQKHLLNSGMLLALETAECYITFQSMA